MPPIIPPDDLSFRRIERSLQGYVRSVLEEDGAWTDFFESSTGQIITRMMAGLGAFISYRFEFLRREQYLDSALMRSSIYLLAQFLGYPIRRKNPPLVRVRITYTPSGAPLGFWPRNQQIGTIGGLPLSPLEDIAFAPENVNGFPFEVTLAVGQWVSTPVTRVTPSNQKDWASFAFAEGDYDIANLRDPMGNQLVFLRGTASASGTTEADPASSLTEIPEDLVGLTNAHINELCGPEIPDTVVGKILIQTSYRGGVIARFGDGTVGRRVQQGDMFLEYMRTQGPVAGLGGLALSGTIPDIVLSNVNPSLPNNVKIVSPGSLEDSLAKLKTVVPSYYSALRRAVTAEDHTALLMNFSGDMVSASAYKDPDVECCTVNMSYLFRDEHRASAEEAEAFAVYMDDFRMFGYQLLFIDPIPVGIVVRLAIVLSPDAVSREEIRQSVEDEIQGILFKLGVTFHTADMIAAIHTIPGILRVYLETPLEDRALEPREYFRLHSLTCSFSSSPSYSGEFAGGGCGSPLLGYYEYTQPEIDAIQGVA